MQFFSSDKRLQEIFFQNHPQELDCCRVKICLLIRKCVFKVDALVGAVAPQTDLLIGNEIIEQLAKENFSIG